MLMYVTLLYMTLKTVIVMMYHDWGCMSVASSPGIATWGNIYQYIKCIHLYINIYQIKQFRVIYIAGLTTIKYIKLQKKL